MVFVDNRHIAQSKIDIWPFAKTVQGVSGLSLCAERNRCSGVSLGQKGYLCGFIYGFLSRLFCDGKEKASG